jgi:hypothetical protein
LLWYSVQRIGRHPIRSYSRGRRLDRRLSLHAKPPSPMGNSSACGPDDLVREPGLARSRVGPRYMDVCRYLVVSDDLVWHIRVLVGSPSITER